MGWGSGSRLMDELIELLETVVTNESEKKELFKGMITAFEDFDCDTLNECVGRSTAFDEAYSAIHPIDEDEDDWYDEDDDYSFEREEEEED